MGVLPRSWSFRAHAGSRSRWSADPSRAVLTAAKLPPSPSSTASRPVHEALWFLVHWPEHERAAELVVTRTKELDGDLYHILVPAAEALDAKHPLAATLIRRALIDFTLGAARSSRYRHAARHLRECQSLAGQIDDFGAFETHEAYRARLKAEHGRKTSFWGLLD
jgi:uncharacterized Zn finger protein